ncbi:Thg1 C terminal domain-containing protein [Cristinia sonorae]|uniref:tRNA(His) guanylyltransferase n=1 Tax=Cristinia sonorae TaxID=1940300 RepID=A0A8K0UR03_9AGAR|nr:Thg1 C terminal domain-containing protein [Cristinia sonorae]
MAVSKFAYVKSFEQPDSLLPNTYIVVRVDGHAFHRLSQDHQFIRPNDDRALQLMDHAAKDVMKEFTDIVMAFGESDEYSFLFRKTSTAHKRRHAKILSIVTSTFTSSYAFHWSKYLPNTPLQYPPTFDARVVLYPSAKEIRDYFSWRQSDTHVNNLYNTIFWALVQQAGETTSRAHEILKGTVSKQKNEMLYSRFGINYNDLPLRYRKGTTLVREKATSENTLDGREKPSSEVVVLHCDIIKDEFWDGRRHLLE